MIIYSLLFITLLLGFIAMGLLVRPKHWSRLLLGCSLAVFIHLYGGWFLISYYTRYVFDAVAVVLLLAQLLRKGIPLNQKSPWRIAVNVLLTLVLAALSVLYFTGTRPAPPVAQLHFPFKAGKYFVLQGGRGLPSNLFHGNSPHSIYALDIVKLNRAGQRANRVFSKNLNDYFIFADTIYSPCDGIVARAIADNPDNIPPNHTRGPHNLNGVVIQANDYTVFLGHMKQACVFVKAGDVVKTGTPLGLAGNSGFSIEPHLHIQVHEKGHNGEPWYRQRPMYVSFSGHEYLLFQLIEAAP